MRYLLLYTAWAVGTPADSIPTEQNWGMDDFESAFSKLKSSVTGSEPPAEDSSKSAKLETAKAAAALHQAQKHASNALHAAQNAASDKLHQSQTSAVQKFGFGDLQTAFSNFTKSAKAAYHDATDTAEEAYHKAEDKATAAFHEHEDNVAPETPATPPVAGDNEDEASEAFRQAQDEATAKYRAAHNAAHRQYQHALNEITQQWDFASLRKQFLGKGAEETPAKAPAGDVKTATEQKWDFPNAADFKKSLEAAKKKAMEAYHDSLTEASNKYHEDQKKATSDYHAKQGEATNPTTKTEEKWGFDDLKGGFEDMKKAIKDATAGMTSETTSESDTLDEKSDEAAKAAEQERAQHEMEEEEERAKAELEEEEKRAKEEARQEEERAKEEARQEEERAKQELEQEQHRAKVESEAGEEAENNLREAASHAAESRPEPRQPPHAPKGISPLNQEILQASHFHADPNSPIKIAFYMSSGGEGSETFYREQLERVLENPGIPTQLELIPQFDEEDIGSSDGKCNVCANGDKRAQQVCKANLVISIVELEDMDKELRNRIYHVLIQHISEPKDGSEDFWVHGFEGNDKQHKLAEMKSMIEQKLLDCKEMQGVIREMRQKFKVGARDAEEQLRHFGLPEASKTPPYVFVDDILLPLHKGSLHLEDSKLASLDDVLCEMNPNSVGCKVKRSIARYSVFRGPELNVCLQNLALITAALLLSVVIILWLRVANRRRYHISTEADVLLEEAEEP